MGCVTKRRAKQFCEMKTLLSIPTIRRYWRSTGTKVPYQGIHDLLPGTQWWTANPRPTEFSQHYVSLRGLEAGAHDLEHRPAVYDEDIRRGVAHIPAEAAIARELLATGAEWAVFNDCFAGRRSFALPNLRCIAPDGELAQILAALRDATSRQKLGGLPDAIAKFADGRVVFREAKHVSKTYKDAWGPKQADMARAAQRLWPGRVDIAVVEWGDSYEAAPAIAR
jgi:hypothetical protein